MATKLRSARSERNRAVQGAKDMRKTNRVIVKRITELEPDAARLDWLERVHTLHKQVEFLYVVDGYLVTLVNDGNEVDQFHGKDLRDALDQARAAHPDPDRYWSKV